MYKTEGRTLRQNKMIHALISDIVRHTYNDSEATSPQSFKNDCKVVKDTLKVAYATEAELPADFSTAKMSKLQARDFISSIIEFCFQFDVPLSLPGLQMTDDINRYLFLCIKYRKCAITGRRGEIHHVDSVGIGRDRRDYDHSKSRLICLSREKHTEAHQNGWLTFKNKYHVDGIYLSPEAVKELNI
ncbi:TPA: putative HNHc nuclease [Listeria monocytogenes]